SAQIREILINESAWEEMTCLFALSLSNKLPAVAGKIRQRMFYMDSQDVLYIVRCYGVVKRSFTAPGHQLAYGSLKVADGELDKVACKIHRTGENSPVSHDKP
ncbi:hypothetical protein NXF62_27805, partial [Klebsiella pneumoniae]|nr:hypothetical protein [Klebsiella pneumoniae]MDS6912732.1 hypothetical protein [Klebsiella pneumoniae]MDS7039172.1 hypothetical protein [Klebsiella pneumoniae]MDS7055655.1 hypothetical protein [Klebsiella pneumoniae]MDS7070921.1 hypothetical protein [Klebsiella pneumoniae]